MAGLVVAERVICYLCGLQIPKRLKRSASFSLCPFVFMLVVDLGWMLLKRILLLLVLISISYLAAVLLNAVFR